MAGRPIQRERLAKLNELGEDAIFDLYVELGSVRKIMQHIFKPPKESYEWGRRDFYRWLRETPERWERWTEAQQDRAHVEADEVSEVGENIDPENVAASRVKLSVHQWRAEKLNRAAYGPPASQVNVGVGVQIGQSWLEALKATEAQAQKVPTNSTAQQLLKP